MAAMRHPNIVGFLGVCAGVYWGWDSYVFFAVRHPSACAFAQVEGWYLCLGCLVTAAPCAKCVSLEWEMAGVAVPLPAPATAIPTHARTHVHTLAHTHAHTQSFAPAARLPAVPPCVVTEYCSKGSLTDVLKAARQSPAAAARLDWGRRLGMVGGAWERTPGRLGWGVGVGGALELRTGAAHHLQQGARLFGGCVCEGWMGSREGDTCPTSVLHSLLAPSKDADIPPHIALPADARHSQRHGEWPACMPV